MGEYRRSLLQAKILLQLEEKSAKTITELAERVGSLRPAVSRSLHTLKEQNLVCRKRNGWHLTEAGRTETTAAKTMLVEMTEKVQSLADRTSEAWGRVGLSSDVIKAIGELSALYTASFGKAISEITKSLGTSSLFVDQSPILDIVKTMSVSSQFNISDALSSAIKPLIEAQECNTALLKKLTSSIHPVGIEAIAQQNNLLLASAINDALAIRQAELIQSIGRVGSAINFSWLSTDLVNVNRSFEQLFRHSLEQIDFSHLSTSLPVLTDRIVVPTATVAFYTDSLHSLIDAETMTNVLPLVDQGFEELGDNSLDASLHELNPDFVEMRQGAWSALCGSNPDRLRHAGSSQRELLRQLLEQLAPNNLLPADNRQGPQIKARIKVALGASDSDAEFIENLAKAIESYYSQLNKYVHHNKKHEESLRALIHTGEGLIRFILAKVNLASDKLN